MRWVKHKPRLGDRRTRRRFLWLPKTIMGEVRWLEVGRWVEEYQGVNSYKWDKNAGPVIMMYASDWIPLAWETGRVEMKSVKE